MSIQTIRRIIEENTDKLVQAGIPHDVVTSAMVKAEATLLNAYFAKQKDLRDQVAEHGTQSVSRSHGVSQRTVQRWFNRAVDELRHA